MHKFDWLIRGGHVIDPANGVDGILDVAIQGRHLAAVKGQIDPTNAENVYDATGQLVVPGLVDLHVHGFHLATPLGVDMDHYCLGRGVTTVVDAGSAGCNTLPAFRAFAAKRFQARMLGFLNISCLGLTIGSATILDEPGELDLISLVNTGKCVTCVNTNRDLLVGVKVRLSDSIADNGRNEAEAYARATEAARTVKLPLMVHHSHSTVSMEDCPGKMIAGDIYTHCYHGFRSTIVDPESRKVLPVVRDAQQRGVLFDIGHGMGAFNWTVVEICAAEDFWPDTISTDLHSLTHEGPAYDLPTVMTRLLHVGMPLKDIIERTTVTPARAIGWENRIGTLGVGREADVAVLSCTDVDLELEDCQSQMRRIKQRLSAEAVWRAGRRCQITQPKCWPNPETIAECRAMQQHLLVRDT